MKNFEETFNELNKINEEYKSVYLNKSNYDRGQASKEFWNNAKQGLIDVTNFHKAYDKELNDLNLLGLFLDDGKFYHKSVYGTLKLADQNSWAVKAAMKFCGMQFWDLASTIEEKRAAERAEEERIAQEKTELFLSMKDALLSFVEKVYAAGEVDFSKLFEAKAQLRYLNSQRNAINAGEDASTVQKEDISNEIKQIKVEAYHPEKERTFDWHLEVGEIMNFSAYLSLWQDDVLNKSKSEIKKIIIDRTSSQVDWELKKTIEDVKTAESQLQYVIKRKEAERAEKARVDAINKEIKDAIAKGEQPRKEITDMLIKHIHDTLDHAQNEYKSWSSYKYDDGDSVAAYYYALSQGEDKFIEYVRDTHWESENSKFYGGTEKEFEDAVNDLFNSKTKTITFVK